MGMKDCYEVFSHYSGNSTPEELWTMVEEEEQSWAIYKIPIYVLVSLMFGLGILGNALVLVVYTLRYPASTTKVFIIGMAAFDLLNCIFGVPLMILLFNADFRRHERVECRTLPFISSSLAFGSISVLLSVAVDRYRRICRPLKRQITVSQSKVIVGVIVPASIFFSIPFMIVYQSQPLQLHDLTVYFCSTQEHNPLTGIYHTLLGILLIVTFALLAVLYACIVRVLYKQKQNMKSHLGVQQPKSGRSDTSCSGSKYNSYHASMDSLNDVKFSESRETSYSNKKTDDTNKTSGCNDSLLGTGELRDSKTYVPDAKTVSLTALKEIARDGASASAKTRLEKKSDFVVNDSEVKLLKKASKHHSKKIGKAKRSGRQMSPRRCTFMMLYVTVGLFISYFPYLVARIHENLASNSFKRLLCSPGYYMFYSLAICFVFLNNAINPVIYGYYNVIFRRDCRELATTIQKRLRDACMCLLTPKENRNSDMK